MIFKSLDLASEVDLRLSWGYAPNTKLALKWIKTDEGKYCGVDRGVSEDEYLANINITGTFAEIQLIQAFLRLNQEGFLLKCFKNQEVFGADIDYSDDLEVAVNNYGEYSQVQKNLYQFNIVLRLVTRRFLSVTGSLEKLRISGFNHVETREFQTKTLFTYDNAPSYYTDGTDPYRFEAIISQSNQEMAEIRRYIASQRENTITLQALNNPSFPFSSTAGAGPYQVKIISFKENPRENYFEWTAKIIFSYEGAQ